MEFSRRNDQVTIGGEHRRDERAGARRSISSHRAAFMGICQHRHPFWQVPAARRGHYIEEKFADAAQVNALTGITPQLALHVDWDLPSGTEDVARTKQLAAQYGVRAGSINPNLFQDQDYKFGSICNPDPGIRRKAVDHLLESVR